MRPHEHTAESQSDITRVLVTHFHTPLPDGHHIRGVLPTPTDAIRIVTGPRHKYAPKHLAVWEMPLIDPEGLEGLTPWRAWDALRSLHTPGAAVPPSTGETLGMPLTQVDPWNLTPEPPARDDRAYVALYALTHPSTDTPRPNPRLRGFLLTSPDRLRLYVDRKEDGTEVTAADIRPTGATTALLAALHPLLDDPLRRTPTNDPHCTRLLDFTDW
ncbi:hypothetical protein [Streptomyces acidiscabies]|uniref:Uncharacterized protein n=1 Tax=Streptomyces acidiscabies TaxID=42234 RepID=A0AAP6BIG8_9ACTN|nr:hypothetical protein [Streptomyces acidiscabies]MBP5938577.1 hypothetical protein [Streptomyces sp. LBUM 1476]MBZ3909672.1 hypothetical protein [Streptomyces acidiscabies]MDX2965366.1 hypothetical protein [Streptomyces acidiscabies]MDX3024565.1 hypothetical protein [Streptomyces acidiscabies]MDX3795200.1 hypothetical protein [Streptomyces acidiscabies]